ncbi:MAG: histone deacetylase [Gemmatimonadaceae bacterium]
MPLHLWSSDRYAITLPEGHRFPIAKYAQLRARVIDERIVPPEHLHEPARASRDDIARVHAADYIERVATGTLSPAEVRRLGLPWSPELVERSYRSTGGTCEAARAALTHGVAMNLAGGTHHAFADRGEGYCVWNDAAVAIRALQHEGRIAHALIVDLDVHQGNGTHAIFADDRNVVTFSMHGGKNFPFHKVSGSVDIDLADGTGDDEYLAILGDTLPRLIADAAPDLVLYLAGADPHEGDRLGRLKLTFDGLARRDALVLATCRDVGVPVAITIAGGYGRDIRDTVAVHVNTVRVARQFV